MGGCGDDDEEPAPGPGETVPTRTEPSRTGPEPTATTGEPPGGRRGPPPAERGTTYRCGSQELSAQPPDGPVRVFPNWVHPGESFTVTILDRDVRTAAVSLAGVSDEPIFVEARRRRGRLRATVPMPAEASCGNKLVTVEGDLSARASIGVSR